MADKTKVDAALIANWRRLADHEDELDIDYYAQRSLGRLADMAESGAITPERALWVMTRMFVRAEDRRERYHNVTWAAFSTDAGDEAMADSDEVRASGLAKDIETVKADLHSALESLQRLEGNVVEYGRERFVRALRKQLQIFPGDSELPRHVRNMLAEWDDDEQG